MWMWLQLIIPLFRRRWMSCFQREQLNHLLMVLVSIPVCMLFLSMLVTRGPYLTLIGLIIICIYLLLRCLPSDMSGNLFSMVYMFSPLISKMFIYIFLLLSIIIIFIICLAQYSIYTPRVFTVLTKPISFLCHCKGFHIVIYLGDILILVSSKWSCKRAHSFLCSLLVCLGLHINFSKSDLCLTQTFCFIGLCWDTGHMSLSLPPDKLPDVQQLALSLLQTQSVTVCWVMSFLGKANLSASGQSQL